MRRIPASIWWKIYSEYLKSTAWKLKRKLVLRRAKGMCEICKIKKAKQVHHLNYERLGKERLSDLRAVCWSCHRRIHKK